MVTKRQIRAFSKRVAEEFKPDRIILFGSYANGSPTEDSDVDLLVVMPFKGRPVDQSVDIRLKTRPSFPIDLIVRTPKGVKKRVAMGDDFMKDILEEGTVLYEAHHKGMGGKGRG